MTRAKTERALIYWADETAVAEHVRGIRGYAPMGKTPVLAAPTKRYGLTMISVLQPTVALIPLQTHRIERWKDLESRCCKSQSSYATFLISNMIVPFRAG